MCIRDRGYGARDVAVMGDSAGGNLALVLTLMLRDARRQLPRRLVLFSPWTDMTFSGESFTQRAGADPSLTADYMLATRDAYAPGADWTDPLLSPLFGDFSGFPPVMIQALSLIHIFSLMGIDEKGRLLGGMILPGPKAALNALVKGTAQLPQVDLDAPRAALAPLAKNSAACLQAGSILGTAAMLDGLIARLKSELGENAWVAATGELPEAVLKAKMCIRDRCRVRGYTLSHRLEKKNAVS